MSQIGKDPSEEINRARAIFSEASMEQIVGMEKDIYSLMNTYNKESVNKLPEHVFVDFFLPYFSGKLNLKDSEEPITKWIGIAGSPTKEVDIIDNNTGEILFRVPSLINTTKLNVTKNDRRIASSEILAMSARKADSGIPGNVESYLMSVYPLKIQQLIKENDVDKDDLDKWKYIFNRYGIEIQDDREETKQEIKRDFYDYDNSFELAE